MGTQHPAWPDPRLQQAAEENPVGVAAIGVDGRISEVNEALSEFFGLGRDDLVGRDWHDLTQLDSGQTNEGSEAATTDRAPSNAQPVRHVRPDGEVRYGESKLTAMSDSTGAVGYFIGHIVDRTADHRAAHALELSEQRFRLLAENASDVVAQLDPHGIVQWVSPSVTRVLGWDVDDLLGRPYFDLVVPADLSVAAPLAAALSRGEPPGIAECRLRHRNGDHRWVSVHTTLLADGGPTAGAVIGIRDVQSEVATRRALATLSAGNAAVAHAATEDELLRTMCQTAVEHGGYLLAWYGRPLHDEHRSVHAAASSEAHGGYLDEITITWDESAPSGQGPTGTCLRTGTTQILQDFAGTPGYEPWFDAATQHGFRSSISIRVHVDGVVDGAFMVYADEPDAFDPRAVSLLEDLARTLGQGLGRLRDHRRLDRALESAVDLLAATVEFRDPYTAGHQANTAHLAVAVGQRLGLDDDRIRGLRYGATIHDVGKIAVPIEILTRPGRLSPEQMTLVRSHAAAGAEIAARFDWPWPVATMIRQHHERMDGSGYPDGLADDEILLEARIIAVADVFEAVSSARPYRPALGSDRARQVLHEGRGVLFDDAVVDALDAVLDDGLAVGGQSRA